MFKTDLKEGKHTKKNTVRTKSFKFGISILSSWSKTKTHFNFIV